MSESTNIDYATTIDSLEFNKDSERESWILYLLRGIAWIIFGFAAVIWPGATLVTVAFVFSVFILVNGIFDIINGIRAAHGKGLWFLRVLLGFLEIGVGVWLLRQGFVVSTVVLLQAAALLLIIQAIVEFVMSFTSKIHGGMRVLMIINSLLGFVIGIALARYPVTSGVTFTWLFGIFGLVGGAMSIAGAFAIRPRKE